MNIKFVNKKLENINSDIEIILVIDENLKHEFVKDKNILDELNYKGSDETIKFLPESKRVYVGVSSLENNDDIRIATANAIKVIKATNYKSAKIALYFDNDMENSVKALVEGFILGTYSFDKYLSKKDKSKIENIYISEENYLNKKVFSNKIKETIQKSIIIANSTNLTRDIVNTIPNDATPQELAKIAQKIANENNLICKIKDGKYLKDKGMNSFLAVSRASVHDAQLIHLTYKPKNPKSKVVLVGKGLTYDSGGLSLKPANFMTTMKSDKSGACALLGVMNAVSKMDLDIQVDVVIGACENMIGGDAYKPDDVLIAKNGVSIEVENTDAEGRLVLADCLCYAQDKVKDLDYILDFATLTGACVVAVGEYTSGLMGHNEELKNDFKKSATTSGELTTSLEFNKYLKKSLKSQIADVSHISKSRYGGAITAAMFLDYFIEEKNKDKWIHVDIAGPAFVEKSWGYNPHGASGTGVRMTLKWLEDLNNRINSK
jgi:leucyl aminopeptidase